MQFQQHYHIPQHGKFIPDNHHFQRYGQIERGIVYLKEGVNYLIDGAKRLEYFQEDFKYITSDDLIDGYRYLLNTKEISTGGELAMINNLTEEEVPPKEIYLNLLKGVAKCSLKDISHFIQSGFCSHGIPDLVDQLDIELKELKIYNTPHTRLKPLLELFLKISANRNHRKDLYLLIDEIIRREEITLETLLEDEAVVVIMAIEQNPDRLSKFKKYCHTRRSPTMTTRSEPLQNLSQKIPVKSIKMGFPLEQESKQIPCGFTFNDLDSFDKKMVQLTAIREHEAFIELVNRLQKQ